MSLKELDRRADIARAEDKSFDCDYRRKVLSMNWKIAGKKEELLKQMEDFETLYEVVTVKKGFKAL